MICDNCYDREDCKLREERGHHVEKCAYYFPDLGSADCRNPNPLATPEDRRKPMARRRK